VRRAWAVAAAAVATVLVAAGIAAGAFTVHGSNPQELTAAGSFPTSGLRVQSRTNDNGASGAQIQFGLRLRNTGDQPVDLSQVTLRYWFTADNRTGDPVPACYYAAFGCGQVSLGVTRLTTLRDDADTYLQVGFTGGSLAGGADASLDQLALRDPNGATYRQDNDFSFAAQTSFADNPNVTAYVGGQLAWGTEPERVAERTALEVQYANLDPDPRNEAIKFQLKVVNTGTTPIDMGRVTIRYWFTREAVSSSMLGFCDYAQIGCADVTTTFGTVDPARPGADTYLDVEFTGGTGGVGGSTGPIQLRAHKADYSVFDETDDHSWATNTEFATWTRVTAYLDGELVWGTEP